MKLPEGTSTWLRFSTMGIQMGAIIFFGSLLGQWLDDNWPSENISFHPTLTLFAVFGAIYSFIRQVIRLSKEDDMKMKNKKSKNDNSIK
jgi:hypothetical protein